MMLGGGGFGGGSDGDPFGEQMAMLAGIPLQVNPAPVPAPEMVGTSGGRARGKEERVPQWGKEETLDLIAIRADLEQRDLAVGSRGKTLWEAAAARMRERGHRRTPEQCKCKWKNLVNRYKGKETADAYNVPQCPFFDELNAVFVERAKGMRRQLLDSDSGAAHPNKKLKRLAYSDELSDDDNNHGCEDDETDRKSRRKKAAADNRGRAGGGGGGGVQELLRELLLQQRRMDAQWQEMAERRAQERLTMEEEWRRRMEGLERERRAMEEAWREREEQRRAREESRAERREELLATLLNKLSQDEL